MNILSLFDGMGCARIAIDQLGLPVTNYFASEVDKHAIKITKTKWPDGQHVGILNQDGNLSITEKSTCIDANYFKGMDNHSQRTMILSMPTIFQSANPFAAGLIRIRRLTPIEVCRLQTVPDEYFFYPTGHINKKKKPKPILLNGELRTPIVSESQIYKMCGNGFTIEVIKHILKYYENEKTNLQTKIQ